MSSLSTLLLAAQYATSRMRGSPPAWGHHQWIQAGLEGHRPHTHSAKSRQCWVGSLSQTWTLSLSPLWRRSKIVRSSLTISPSHQKWFWPTLIACGAGACALERQRSRAPADDRPEHVMLSTKSPPSQSPPPPPLLLDSGASGLEEANSSGCGAPNQEVPASRVGAAIRLDRGESGIRSLATK